MNYGKSFLIMILIVFLVVILIVFDMKFLNFDLLWDVSVFERVVCIFICFFGELMDNFVMIVLKRCFLFSVFWSWFLISVMEFFRFIFLGKIMWFSLKNFDLVVFKLCDVYVINCVCGEICLICFSSLSFWFVFRFFLIL